VIIESSKGTKGSKAAIKGDENHELTLIGANNADFPELNAVRARGRGPL
jgi:hypothetical protein